jgi:hypothetical protein
VRRGQGKKQALEASKSAEAEGTEHRTHRRVESIEQQAPLERKEGRVKSKKIGVEDDKHQTKKSDTR